MGRFTPFRVTSQNAGRPFRAAAVFALKGWKATFRVRNVAFDALEAGLAPHGKLHFVVTNAAFHAILNLWIGTKRRNSRRQAFLS